MSFGVIVSGRPVITNADPVSENQVAIEIPSVPSFSHIVVFLLPGVALPDGTAAAVYARLPNTAEFKLLGAIANEKPSAIFKIRNKPGGPAGGGLGDNDTMVDEGNVPSVNGAVPPLMLGISVEPAIQVAANLEQKKVQEAAAAAATTTTPTPTTISTTGNELVLRGRDVVTKKVLAQRIIKNCYDFLSGWGAGDMVPMKAFQAWWTKFENKIERDPGFLERSSDG